MNCNFWQIPATKLVADYQEEAANRDAQILDLTEKRGGAQVSFSSLLLSSLELSDTKIYEP